MSRMEIVSGIVRRFDSYADPTFHLTCWLPDSSYLSDYGRYTIAGKFLLVHKTFRCNVSNAGMSGIAAKTTLSFQDCSKSVDLNDLNSQMI
jgi:hypothetical protein